MSTIATPVAADFIFVLNNKDVVTLNTDIATISHATTGPLAHTTTITVKTVIAGGYEFIDTNNNDSHDAGEYIVGIATGSSTGTLDLSKLTNLAVKTTGTTGADSAGNVLKKDFTLVVK